MWFYKDKEINSITEFPKWETLYGFIYIIRDKKNNKFYIGRKNFRSITKKKLLKKELSADKRIKTYKYVIKESSWLHYCGSNQDLLVQMNSNPATWFHKEIISLAYGAKELTYREMEAQVKHNVLEVDNCYNDNISGRYFRKDLIQ